MTGQTDPRVLFAAERTLFSWNRTGISLMAFGVVVVRFGLYMQILGVQGVLGAQRHLSFIGGMGFILLGAFVEIYSVLQHRHFLASLHEMDIPVGYNTRAAMAIYAAVGFMGVMLCGYLFLGVL